MPLSEADKVTLRALVARVSATDAPSEEQHAALARALTEAGLDPTPAEWAAFSREELGARPADPAGQHGVLAALDAIMAESAARGTATLGALMAELGVATPGALLTALGFTGDTAALGAEVEAALHAAHGLAAPDDGDEEEEQALHCRLVAEGGVPTLQLAWLSHEAASDANFELGADDPAWTRLAAVGEGALPDFMAATLTPLLADMIARVADPARATPPSSAEFVARYEPYFSGLLESAYATGIQIRAGRLPDEDDLADEGDEWAEEDNADVS